MFLLLRRAMARRIDRFVSDLFGETVLVLVIRRDSVKLAPKDRMPFYEISKIALISPDDTRVDTIELSQTYKLDYGDLLHLVMDIRAGID